MQHRVRGAGAALQEGWSEAEVCAEKLPLRGGLCAECPGGSHCGSIGKKSTIRKKSTIEKKRAIGKKRAKMGNLHYFSIFVPLYKSLLMIMGSSSDMSRNSSGRSGREKSSGKSTSKSSGRSGSRSRLAAGVAKWLTTSGRKWYQNWILKNIVVAGGSMVLLCVVLVWLSGLWTRHGSEFALPDFCGSTIAEAQELAQANELKLDVTDSVYLPHIKAGLVLKQNPDAGSNVKRGRRILLTINSLKPKMVEMPLVTGYFLREASFALERNSLRVGKLIYVEDIASNNVLRQLYKGREIKAGTKIASQSEIDLEVGIATTDNTTFIPNLEGMPYSIVKEILTDNSLNLGKAIFNKGIKNYMDSLNAVVYKQIPQPVDTPVILGTSVTLYFKSVDKK
ncbi:MAG: PASTA domain-containing protein [Candidatus Egerieousia sp.]|nr:PASTA domain-containing protein [Candidatus Egerieousia sp.]